MQSFPPTIILRHRRENKKKCSLGGLDSRSNVKFIGYPRTQLPDVKGYLLLAIDAPVLTKQDSHYSLFLVDSTWRYVDRIMGNVPGIETLPKRSLPKHFKTAYPRRQDDCPEPEYGLASIEALYIAYHILGWDTAGLLDQYHWKDQFLEINDWT